MGTGVASTYFYNLETETQRSQHLCPELLHYSRINCRLLDLHLLSVYVLCAFSLAFFLRVVLSYSCLLVFALPYFNVLKPVYLIKAKGMDSCRKGWG